MAKKSAKPAAKKKAAAPKKAATRTSGVRNSPVPKKVTPRPVAAAVAPAAKRDISHEMIARRAYEISQSATCGSELDNWLRAERELHG